jgi:hypothetical protein
MTPRFTSWLVLALASSATLFTASAQAEPKAAVSAPKANSPKAAPSNAPAVQADTPAKTDGTAAAAPPAAPEGPADASPGKDKTDEAGAKEPSKDASLVADAEAGGSPVELSGQTYLGVGLRYRAIIVPKFMMNLFGSGGRTVLANGLGPEFTVRKNAFEYEFSALFTSYAMDPTPFKASSDGADAWEIVESKIKVLYLTADFMWSQDFTPEFAFNYGLGAGFGLVWGDLKRTQAYPGAGANDSTGQGYLPCVAQGTPAIGGFCGTDNNHYGGYTEPSWANGGSKPVIFPWLALQTGVRWKPHRNFIARFDAGFGTSGFFLGLGADYGL